MAAAIAAGFKMMKLCRGGAQIGKNGSGEYGCSPQVNKPAGLDGTVSGIGKIVPDYDVSNG